MEGTVTNPPKNKAAGIGRVSRIILYDFPKCESLTNVFQAYMALKHTLQSV